MLYRTSQVLLFQPDPFHLLLGIVPVETLQSSPLKLIDYLFAAATTCVTECWKNEHASSKYMWLGLCTELAVMERFTSILQQTAYV
jgi:hypothetical protein